LIIPKKSLGQNFLIDKNISKKIVNLADNIYEKNIIEIGPGKGALTDEILKKKPKKIILIEKDKFLYEYLLKKYKNSKKIILLNQDALNYDYALIKNPKSIISNLPYNISIKLIIQWLKNPSKFEEIIIMIQKEVAQKMQYKNIKKRNRLNVITELSSNFNIEFNVSKNVFYPKPKIMSSVIKIKPKKNHNIDINKLENFTRDIFKNKRKKISNVINFKKIKNKEKIIKLNILNLRAEDLNIDQIIKIFNEYQQI